MNFIPKIEYIELHTGLAKAFTFDSPPEGDPFGESIQASTKVTKSNNGTEQVQFNYIEEKFDLEFIFQSETTKDSMKEFFIGHAARGGKFNYFPSSDEVAFEEYTIVGKALSLSRPIPAAIVGTFEYDFKLGLKRVL